MMEYIEGTLAASSLEKTVIENGGIGYRILTSLSTYGKLPKIGDKVKLFLSFIVREDSHKYFGFLTVEERDLFEVLTQISGIGPKTALALLGHLDATDLQLAISNSDIRGICKVPGIGKKTAERLIIELRDKVQKKPLVNSALSSKQALLPSAAQDALSALLNLGYTAALAQKAITSSLEELGQDIDLSSLITSSLKKL